MAIAIPIVVLLILAAAGLLVTARRRSVTTGRLSRETVRRDASVPGAATSLFIGGPMAPLVSSVLFGNEDARGIVLLKPYADYYDQYVERVAELEELFPLSEVWRGEGAIKMFIQLFGSILRLRNILTSFDEFAGDEVRCRPPA